jgi:hypothetical protein
MITALEHTTSAEQSAREVWDDEGGSGLMGPQAVSHVARSSLSVDHSSDPSPDGLGPLFPGSIAPTGAGGPEAGGYDGRFQGPMVDLGTTRGPGKRRRVRSASRRWIVQIE